ncbi:ABC transporter permease [Pseudodesulfovibrio sediminis]|uniref:Iron ABC transporter permease n=1 Tax=Pseudodesulfovibrio sediminis TaxID=2810563 RepID=A0ABM7P8K7_9BACT|nr:iron ABC transporter permease [Pseudodesulfovibrio sediminis]BCS89238.1 iron ABC transporter permease [Pseudodesulfovibrio sediminis]
MRKHTYSAPGEVGPWVILSWTIIAFLAYWLLPWIALDYGLTDSTMEELLDAMAWNYSSLTMIVPAYLALIMPFAWIRLPGKGKGIVFTTLAGLGITGILYAFISTNTALGLGAGVVILCLAALGAIGVSELGYQRGDTFIAGAVIFVIFMVITFIFFPVWEIFNKLIFDGSGELAPFQFFEIITSFGIGRVIWNTLKLAFSVGAATTLFGLIFALYAVRATTRLRYLIRVFYILPIITPPFVVGMAMILLFGRAGMINDGLMMLFGPHGSLIPDIFERSGYIYGYPGIFLAQVLSLTPVSYMVISGMLSSINPAMEEASLTMRADRWATLWNVTFPLLRPAIANAFLLGMISSAADFGNPLVLGGDYDVLSTEIYFSIAGAQLDFTKAAALGLILLILSLSVFLIQKKWVGKKSYVTVTGVETAGNLTPLPAGLQRGLTLFISIWLVLVGFLYVSIFLGGFVTQWGADYSLTMKHHTELWLNGFSSGGWPSFFNSLSYSMLAAPLTTMAGILIAYILTRRKFLGRGIIDFGTVLIFAIPGTVTGVAYILAFNTSPLELTGTAAILIITMAIRAMPVGIRGGMSALSQISTNLEEASLLQRAGSFKTLKSVLLPLLKSTIVSSMAYSFIRAMTTVSAVIFLATAGTDVATTYILSRVESGETGVAVAYGSVLILIMLFFTLLVQAFTGRSKTEREVKTIRG